MLTSHEPTCGFFHRDLRFWCSAFGGFKLAFDRPRRAGVAFLSEQVWCCRLEKMYAGSGRPVSVRDSSGAAPAPATRNSSAPTVISSPTCMCEPVPFIEPAKHTVDRQAIARAMSVS